MLTSAILLERTRNTAEMQMESKPTLATNTCSTPPPRTTAHIHPRGSTLQSSPANSRPPLTSASPLPLPLQHLYGDFLLVVTPPHHLPTLIRNAPHTAHVTPDQALPPPRLPTAPAAPLSHDSTPHATTAAHTLTVAY